MKIICFDLVFGRLIIIFSVTINGYINYVCFSGVLGGHVAL